MKKQGYEGCYMEKIIKKRNIFLLLILLLIGILPMNSVYGESEELTGATGFTYSLSFPENQIEQGIGYFKLKMLQGQEQQLTIALSNPGTESVTVKVGLNGAKTNQNGVIEYGDSDIENDASLKFDFTDIVSGPESVELAAGETQMLELTIKMPETRTEGVIAGGIQLMQADQEGNVTSDGGSRIINQYAYVVGVLLQEEEETPLPDLNLNEIYAGQNNYRNTIFVNFSNIIPAYLNDMTVETQINAKGNETVLYERKQTAMRMAPNSFIDFPVSMNGERMVAGTYVANILVTSGEQRWQWSEEFEISQEDSDKFNERDVGLVQEKGLNWQLIFLIVAGALAVIGLIFAILVLIRKKKEAEQKEKQKKRLQAKKSEKKK